jgi:hypothetical protein
VGCLNRGSSQASPAQSRTHCASRHVQGEGQGALNDSRRRSPCLDAHEKASWTNGNKHHAFTRCQCLGLVNRTDTLPISFLHNAPLPAAAHPPTFSLSSFSSRPPWPFFCFFDYRAVCRRWRRRCTRVTLKCASSRCVFPYLSVPFTRRRTVGPPSLGAHSGPDPDRVKRTIALSACAVLTHVF